MMKKIKTYIALMFFGLVLANCSAISTQTYADKTPKLDMRQYLNGNVEAHGILFDINGKADLQFYVTLKGSWNGNTGILEEDFTFNDGVKERRVWKVQFQDDHNFTATAHDVIGEAKGSQYGNAINMKYILNAQHGGSKPIALDMDDWMYLQDAKTLINRTTMKKFGIKVGELVITFRKL